MDERRTVAYVPPCPAFRRVAAASLRGLALRCATAKIGAQKPPRIHLKEEEALISAGCTAESRTRILTVVLSGGGSKIERWSARQLRGWRTQGTRGFDVNSAYVPTTRFPADVCSLVLYPPLRDRDRSSCCLIFLARRITSCRSLRCGPLLARRGRIGTLVCKGGAVGM